MSVRKPHCLGDCSFSRYYTAQAGRGFDDINVFRGSPYQRGHGIGSILSRYALPLVKFIGKHLLRTGLQVGSGVLADNFNKPNLKRRLKEGAKEFARESLTKASTMLESQSGSGIKRKRKSKKAKKKYKKARRRRKDIFSKL